MFGEIRKIIHLGFNFRTLDLKIPIISETNLIGSEGLNTCSAFNSILYGRF